MVFSWFFIVFWIERFVFLWFEFFQKPLYTDASSVSVTPPPHPPSKQMHHPPKNIIFACKILQATTNVNNPPIPHPTPSPIETNASSTEEHHLCLQATTKVTTPPPPPTPPHPPSKQMHHPPKNIIFVSKQLRTSITPPTPHPTPSRIETNASSKEEHHLC